METLGKRVGDALRVFIKKIGIPSLSQLGITEEQAVACAEYAKTEGMRFACLVDIPDSELAEMLRKAWKEYK